MTTQPADKEDLLVHNWRVSRLISLGIPEPLAQVYAGHIDWHGSRGTGTLEGAQLGVAVETPRTSVEQHDAERPANAMGTVTVLPPGMVSVSSGKVSPRCSSDMADSSPVSLAQGPNGGAGYLTFVSAGCSARHGSTFAVPHPSEMG